MYLCVLSACVCGHVRERVSLIVFLGVRVLVWVCACVRLCDFGCVSLCIFEWIHFVGK